MKSKSDDTHTSSGISSSNEDVRCFQVSEKALFFVNIEFMVTSATSIWVDSKKWWSSSLGGGFKVNRSDEAFFTETIPIHDEEYSTFCVGNNGPFLVIETLNLNFARIWGCHIPDKLRAPANGKLPLLILLMRESFIFGKHPFVTSCVALPAAAPPEECFESVKTTFFIISASQAFNQRKRH